MIIKGLQEFTLIDYPGKIACTIFTFGCNFRCRYCHNPELVFDDGTPIISEEKILKFLEERRDFLDGVCITGGEPTLHKDLPEFISKIKSLGISVKLDTNGTNPEMLKKLIKQKLIDFVAMDIKAPLEKYEEVVRTKVNLSKIKESIETIQKSEIDYIFRTTIVPRLLNKNDILSMGRTLKGSKKYCLQRFRPGKTLDKKFQKEKPYSYEEIEEFANLSKPFFEEITII
jgi:pyruvate formate lyase activating enzyme